MYLEAIASCWIPEPGNSTQMSIRSGIECTSQFVDGQLQYFRGLLKLRKETRWLKSRAVCQSFCVSTRLCLSSDLTQPFSEPLNYFYFQ